jgi:hypothetical protein
MIMADKDVMHDELLQAVLVSLGGPIRESPQFDAGLTELIHSVKAQELEGLAA